MKADFPLPESITFTGFDEHTNLVRMAEISRMYPVEWGVLIGGRLGKARYPHMDRIAELTAFNKTLAQPMNLALHVCGEHAKRAMTEGVLPAEIDISQFRRVQINAINYDIPALGRLAQKYDVDVIMQVRGPSFPSDLPFRVVALHDESGGRGTVPQSRPSLVNGQYVGYAGGIGSINVRDVIEAIASLVEHASYWIDMESGVRSSDRFDLEECLAVCRRVYLSVGTRYVQEYLAEPANVERYERIYDILLHWQTKVRAQALGGDPALLAMIILELLIGDSHVLLRGNVKMPETKDEALAMNRLSENWLRSNGHWPE